MPNGLLSRARDLISGYGEGLAAESVRAMESAVRELTSQVGQVVLSEGLSRQEGKYPADSVAGECGGQASYERRWEAMTLTMHGRVSYRRAYYRCGCGQGHYPLDERLGIQPGQMGEQRMTVAARFGISESDERSAEGLATASGVLLSPNSVRRACRDIGQQVVEAETSLRQRRQDLAEQLRQRREGPTRNGCMRR